MKHRCASLVARPGEEPEDVATDFLAEHGLVGG